MFKSLIYKVHVYAALQEAAGGQQSFVNPVHKKHQACLRELKLLHGSEN